ncbi:MAG: hypothetical protein EXX96DRAFT_634622 [Benjaminiella poitrasii]|nr:MAG: hypothetical protein EXX96DRAFT_634622 [Benjaminiella poitrasii]
MESSDSAASQYAQLLSTARASREAPPTATSNGYTFVYLPRSRRMDRKEIRSRFRLLDIDTSRILDITLPARGVVGVLLHVDFQSEFVSLLKACKINTLSSFDPLDPAHIVDPKFDDMTGAQRIQLAKAIQQDRCIRSLEYLREYLVPSVAQYYVQQGWISPTIASSTIRTRLPRPTKRSKTSTATAAAAFLMESGFQPKPDEVMEEFHENAFDSDSEDSDDDIEEPAKDADTTQ